MAEAIAVHGVGMVGGALSRYLKDEGYDVLEYDPFKGLEDDFDVEIQFVAVPTPFENGFDLSMLEEACANIAKVRGDKKTVIVIKSTALPGTTEHFQKNYPQYIFLFNPEFLVEKTADKDMRQPDRQILGYVNEDGRGACEKIMQILPRAPYEKIMKATEAEMVKYFGNTFLATKVIFANMMYDFCEKHGIDYDSVKDAAAQDKRIGTSHLNVNLDGYRGYRGACFPKDVRAFIQHGEDLGVDVGVLKEAERRNCQLIEEPS